MKVSADFVPYVNLVNAMIRQSAREYRRALKKIMADPFDKKAWESKEENEKFFNSDWYSYITNVSSEYIMDRIRKEVGWNDRYS